MNVRPIKGNGNQLELLNTLFSESVTDMEDQCDYARMAVQAAKARVNQIGDKLHSCKYAIRAANREHRLADIRVLKNIQRDFLFDLEQAQSTLDMVKKRYGNCRTIIFMYKSAIAVINSAKEGTE